MSTVILDLFAGGGGFSAGARAARPEAHEIAYELDDNAFDTLIANDVSAVRVDLSTLPPDTRWSMPVADHVHLHASPPCQSFSVAGKGKGREALDVLGIAVRDILSGGEVGGDVDLEQLDVNTRLSLVPAHWIAELEPDTISFEQVRGVLPLWDVYADMLEQLGYDCWTGLVHAEQYGVPQTRTRAILLASKVGEVRKPRPTHSRYHSRHPERLDDGVLPWVTMAEALSMDDGLVGFPRKADGRGETIEIDGERYRGRDFRSTEQPAFNLTEKARSWTHMLQGGVSGEGRPRPASEPAPTIGGKATASVTDAPGDWYGDKRKKANEAGEDWTHLRPSTTVNADPRLSGPGRNDPKVSGSQYGANARRITVAEAAALQTFPSDWEFCGSKTSQFRQIGNAVPPLLVGHLLDACEVPK